ncbi:S-adenosyl-L-methionine-dependent methyltransferase [Aspergillus bertholletiae]|uniref:S-adenosyl-L-methionine-dependent methyltransferase n=1 Tax=Aspergillus bertholletiae TaxID=1226010 RepID=A0A5N7BGN9_9EURO|nr:S-adenosyl-L-methionine-dependent methyltransferase [Aspergillus bertholletiae]
METFLSSFLHDPTSDLKSRFYIPRFTHRLRIAQAWGISTGERILDIGCGQGESCIVLAHLVGPTGHITGIDPAQPEYGSPFTVRQSHTYAKRSALGPSLTFRRADTPSFLRGLDRPAREVFDAVTLFHSLWYFPDYQAVVDLFRAVRDADIPRVYLAEYSFTPSLESQRAHALAAEAQTLFYRVRKPRAPGDLEQNVRGGLDQAAILEAAQMAGFVVAGRGVITPDQTMLEGHFEVQYVTGKKFTQRVQEEGLAEMQEREILDSVTRTREAKEELTLTGDSTGRTLDTWWAVLEVGER